MAYCRYIQVLLAQNRLGCAGNRDIVSAGEANDAIRDSITHDASFLLFLVRISGIRIFVLSVVRYSAHPEFFLKFDFYRQRLHKFFGENLG